MTCPTCLTSPAHELAGELAKCYTCDHIWQNPPEVRATYDKQYVLDRYDKYDTTAAMSALRFGIVRTLCSGGRLLDVGYGNGAFVKLAAKGGFDAYGCDVHGADYGVRDVPLVSTDRWDVVTFFDSLEHFTTFESIRNLSDRCRSIVISYPNRPSDFPKNRNWKHYRPYEHLHYFAVSSLSALFGKKKLITLTDAEDAIRGKCHNGSNIITAVFTSPD